MRPSPAMRERGKGVRAPSLAADSILILLGCLFLQTER